MLSMDDIKYIKRMYDCEGVSIREIMRRTGYHYKTIKKYVEQKDFNKKQTSQKELSSLLDPLKPIIDEWLTEDLKAPRTQRHTAKHVYKRLQSEYSNLLEVKLRTVQYYISQKRKQIRASQQMAYLPLYHPPGEAQVDFGHFAYYDNAAILRDALKLTMSFPYSNAAYCQIFHGENQECLLQGIKNILERMGCVPIRMVFDNLSTAVAHMGKGHARTLTAGFSRFAVHYGFEPFFCNAAAGWEKGNVESKVGYERRNLFVPVPTIVSFKAFNERLFELSEEDNNREHYVKKERMDTLFEEDKKAMHPLNSIAFEVYCFESRIADKYGKVSFRDNRYSTSPAFARQSVYVKATSDTVSLLDTGYHVIMDHPRLYGKGQDSMKWLPYIELMSKRPAAIKYTDFYEQLPENWKKHLENLPTEDKRKSLMSLYVMLKNHTIEVASDALSVTLKNGVQDADSILASYRRLITPLQQMQPLHLDPDVLKMPAFGVNNQKYDEFLSNKAVQ